MKFRKIGSKIAALSLALLMVLGMTGCSGMGSASFVVTPMGDGSYLVQVNDVQIDTSDPDQVMAMIGQMQSGNYTYQAPQAPAPVSETYGILPGGCVVNDPYTPAYDYGNNALAAVLRANGASEAEILQACGLAQSMEEAGFGYGIPGFNIVKKIWAENGVTPEKMYANYHELVNKLASVGINADFGAYDTGYGTVDELCRAVLTNPAALLAKFGFGYNPASGTVTQAPVEAPPDGPGTI